MSTSAVASRSQRQKVSVTLRTIGFALPSTAESWAVVLGLEGKSYCNILVFSWVAAVGFTVQETVQGALGEMKFIQAPVVFGESSAFRDESLGFLSGVVWVYCLGPAGSGGGG